MNKYFYILGFVLFVAGVVFLIVTPGRQKPSIYDGFAQCITDSGAKFYGAFWCGHCRDQKAEFGGSAKLLPYVECSTPDTKGLLQVCKDENITIFPTWQFASSTATTTDRIIGKMELIMLSEKTGCKLPN